MTSQSKRCRNRRLSSSKSGQASPGMQLLPHLRRLIVEPLEDRLALSQILHVDAAALPGGSGDTWGEALVSLQEALDRAELLNTDVDPGNDIADIWIAEGTYRPTRQSVDDSPRSETFQLLDGVALYGGFAGAEDSAEERLRNEDGRLRHETILSGDLLGNDVPDDDATLEDNAYTVVFVDSPDVETILDGLTITGGQSTERNDDQPDEAQGGGVFNRGTLIVTNSTVSGNWAYDGGGIFNFGTLTVTNSTISGNLASRYGGGGGGIYNRGTLTIAHSTFTRNSAYSWGASGGGIHNDGTLTVVNSTFASNFAWDSGAIDNYGTMTVTNSTITGNSADDVGGVSNDGTMTVTNSILAGNKAFGGGSDISGSLSDGSDYNLIGIWSEESPSPGEHSLVGSEDAPLDPRLSDWTDLGNGLWGYLLLPDSPALNAGSNTLAIDTDGVVLVNDQAGRPRIQEGFVDLGAMEGASVPNDGVTYVVEELTGGVTLDGILSFQEAFRAANSNQPSGDAPAGSFGWQDRITFGENVAGRVLLNSQSLTIYGGLFIDGPGANLLTFDGQGACGVFRTVSGTEVSLTGMGITGGQAGVGSGIYNRGTLTVANLTVSGNSASGSGGGIQNHWTGTLTVTDSTISGNSASSGGAGGISNWGTLTVTNSTVSGNSASSGDGGGISNYYGTLTLANSTVSDNSALDHGGGIYNWGGALTLANSTFSGNSAEYDDGGGIYNNGTLTVTNSTVSGNSVSLASGGDGIENSGTLMLTNSIIAGNEGSDIAGALSDGSDYNLIGIWSGDPAVGPNSLWGTWAQPMDPRLGPLGDHGGPTWTMPLLADSPAIDAGDPDPAAPPPTDQRGSPRAVDGDADGTARMDMGAFEYRPGEALVLGRHVFYNNSAFDGNDAMANQADDAAIASDKRALLPGQTATFVNYTSYSRGINGIMVDIAGLRGVPTVADFEFRVGIDGRPGGWTAVTDEPTIVVRAGAGTDGSDRVTIVWPDNAIENQWLQVTVLPTANTGLEEPDVFYFGNAIGEAGNSTLNAIVNATDEVCARSFQHGPTNLAAIDDPYDYNRDRLVNATDRTIARNNQTGPTNMLRLITVPALDAVFEEVLEPESASKEMMPGELAWLSALEQTLERGRSAKGENRAEDAVDELLATYL